MAKIDIARTQINTIKNATQVGENTATRVGNAMDAVVDVFGDYATKNDVDGTIPMDIIEGSGINASGVISTIAGSKRSDYIDVSVLTSLYASNPNSSKLDYNVFYDDTKTFIPGSRFDILANAELQEIAIPEGAKYCIVSARNNASMPILYTDSLALDIHHIKEGDAENVKVTPQSLTAAQKTQARSNIGAASEALENEIIDCQRSISGLASNLSVSQSIDGYRVGVALPLLADDFGKTYHFDIVNQSDIQQRPISVILASKANSVDSSSKIVTLIQDNTAKRIEADITIDAQYSATAKYIIVHFSSSNSYAQGWRMIVSVYEDGSLPSFIGEVNDLASQVTEATQRVNDMSAAVSNINTELGDLHLDAIMTRTDGKSIGCNPAADTYGRWSNLSFQTYPQRLDPIAGTKYVAKVFDTRSYIGRAIALFGAPRNNAYRYIFVTDYTQITTTTTLEVWESIYVDGQYGDGLSQDRHFSVTVPQNGNYLIICGTDTDAATASIIGIKDDLQSLEDSVQDLGIDTESIVKLNNLAETTNKIKNARRLPRVSSVTQGITPLLLLHFSDLHGNSQNLARIKEFADYYATYIDDVLCTGDMVDTQPSAFDFWHDLECDDFLVTIGNHEQFASLNPTTIATPQSVYTKFISPYIANWGVNAPSDAATAYKCYYYKDFTAAKVRLIVLDAYDKGNSSYIATENTWLQGVMASAQTNGLSVLISIHATNNGVAKFDSPFCTLQKKMESSEIPFVFRQSVDSFISGGGDFVAWIGGHGHYDVCGVDSTYTNQVVIAIDTASNAGSPDAYTDTERSQDKANRFFDCFNLFGVDTFQKTIKVIRIGANYDSWLRKKDTMCIQYATSEANPIESPKILYP